MEQTDGMSSPPAQVKSRRRGFRCVQGQNMVKSGAQHGMAGFQLQHFCLRIFGNITGIIQIPVRPSPAETKIRPRLRERNDNFPIQF